MPESSTENSNDVQGVLSDADEEIDNQIKELKTDYRDALTDRPEIAKYIERLHKIIRKQQKKLNKFYKKLKDHKFVRKLGSENKESQTDDGPESNGDVTTWGVGEEKNIADEVKEVAENAMKNTGFVYEPTSGMYYDYNSGYYYNAELRMYYDGNTGHYLEYDEETKQYKYHSTVYSDDKIPGSGFKSKPSHKSKNKRERHKWGQEQDVDNLVSSLSNLTVDTSKNADRKSKKIKLHETEEGEITESSISGSEMSDNVEDKETAIKESGFGCEPCIRIIVEETLVEKLKVGSLFVVTCKGGTMGREGDHAVLIPDISVSKHHAKFVFDKKASSYFITDLGSRNGTWLDGERLSAALQESENFEISHGTIIQVGSTKLLCHVHGGRDTCSSCEPGLVQQTQDATFRNPGAKNPEYRAQLQKLKKKFGVDGVPQDVYHSKGYEDRAEIRRSTVGSSHSSEKTQTASLNELIPQSNKGFKMLSKMGWNEGQKLGKNETGLAEPVPLTSNLGKSGLGVTAVDLTNWSKSAKKKQEILRKTQDRYRNIEGNPAGFD